MQILVSSKLIVLSITNGKYSLAEITGDATAIMQYVRYEEEIVHKRGVELVGWTYDKIVNPSLLSSAVEPLSILRDALRDGKCKFVQLSPLKVKQRIAAYQEKLNDGQAQKRKRKTRKDKGARRSKISRAVVDEDGNDERPRRDIGDGNNEADSSSDLESDED